MTAVTVDGSDPTPPFEQIRRQLAALVRSGALEAGDRLPTVRQLASDLEVAPGTVARAYKELEAAGYVETRRAAGTRVRALPPARSGSVPVADLADAYVSAARQRGAADADILAAVSMVLHPGT